MPTPHGSRGGMAFSADELRVLRRALAICLQPPTVPVPAGPARAEEVLDCLRLADAVDEAVREDGRLRNFLLAEVARYRAAVPGAAAGYLDRLRGALSTGYRPVPDDLAALRTLCATAAGPAEVARRRALLRRCERLAASGAAARDLQDPPAQDPPAQHPAVRLPGTAPAPAPQDEAEKPRRKSGEPEGEPRKKPEGPASAPGAPGPGSPGPGDQDEQQETSPTRRPVPTPAEVFPPKRRPARPPRRDDGWHPGLDDGWHPARDDGWHPDRDRVPYQEGAGDRGHHRAPQLAGSPA